LPDDYDTRTASVAGDTPKRVIVLGTSGAGKTRLAIDLARTLGVPHVEFDALRHGPNWTETPDDEFRELIAEALNGDQWVADGNYSVAREVAWPRATTLVWLDYPFPIILWRLTLRIFRRAVFRVELWNGNRERLRDHFFTRESLWLWVVKTHWRRRRQFRKLFQEPRFAHLEVVHHRSPRAAKAWLRRVADESRTGAESEADGVRSD
jgi:adenylate kinase family enzyme